MLALGLRAGESHEVPVLILPCVQYVLGVNAILVSLLDAGAQPHKADSEKGILTYRLPRSHERLHERSKASGISAEAPHSSHTLLITGQPLTHTAEALVEGYSESHLYSVEL